MIKLICTIALSIGCVVFLNAQALELSPQGIVISPETCMEVTQGDVFTFTTASSCGGDIRIEHESGDEFFFSSTEGSFDFEFDQVGIYIIFCGAQAPDIVNRVESTAACFSVLPVVPTIGQWGVIILSLLLIIFMVSYILEDGRDILSSILPR